MGVEVRRIGSVESPGFDPRAPSWLFNPSKEYTMWHLEKIVADNALVGRRHVTKPTDRPRPAPSLTQEDAWHTVVEEGLTRVTGVCPFCGGGWAVTVPVAGYEAWKDGALIQDALPGLTEDQREHLISGLCLECQVDTFEEEEDGPVCGDRSASW